MQELLKKTLEEQRFMNHTPLVKAFFHTPSHTYSYVVSDPQTHEAAIIDSVLDFDIPSGTILYDSADTILHYCEQEKLVVHWHLETHMHADHISAATYLQEKLGGKTAIGNHITAVQDVYKDVFAVSAIELQAAVESFDHLWADFETFTIGTLPALTFYSPGHTPADVVYVIGNAVFVGDSLFMPDFGSARCDFPRGNAQSLYQSVQQIYTLPDTMTMYLCHDYLPVGRSLYQYQTTIKDQKDHNIHLRVGITEHDFVEMRDARDATLSLPVYMIPSLQINVRAGKIPTVQGRPMLQWPINSIFAEYPKE